MRGHAVVTAGGATLARASSAMAALHGLPSASMAAQGRRAGAVAKACIACRVGVCVDPVAPSLEAPLSLVFQHLTAGWGSQWSLAAAPPHPSWRLSRDGRSSACRLTDAAVTQTPMPAPGPRVLSVAAAYGQLIAAYLILSVTESRRADPRPQAPAPVRGAGPGLGRMAAGRGSPAGPRGGRKRRPAGARRLMVADARRGGEADGGAACRPIGERWLVVVPRRCSWGRRTTGGLLACCS